MRRSRNMASLQRRVSGRGRALPAATFDATYVIFQILSAAGQLPGSKNVRRRLLTLFRDFNVSRHFRTVIRDQPLASGVNAVARTVSPSHSLPIVRIRGTKISSQCWQLFVCYCCICLSLCVRLIRTRALDNDVTFVD